MTTLRGLLPNAQLPTKTDARQAMKNLALMYQQRQQPDALPPMQRQHVLPLQHRILSLEIQACTKRGSEAGRLVTGETEDSRLYDIAIPAQLGEFNYNFKSLLDTLRREIKGGVFDDEVKVYSLLAFSPSPFFFLRTEYQPEYPQRQEAFLMSTDRGTFPLGRIKPGVNQIGFPDHLIEGLTGHPLYSPTLEEWGQGTAENTFAQKLTLTFVPIRNNWYNRSNGEIAVLRILVLAGSYAEKSFQEYLERVNGRMGINIYEFLNYEK